MRHSVAWLAFVVVVLFAAAVLRDWESRAEENEPIRFTDVRTQTRQFIQHYETIELTPEQESVKAEALEPLPAPCCSDNSMLTCCCPCNLSKSIWGLANFLIAERGLDAEGVRHMAQKWVEFVNPDGFDGQACYQRRCATPFSKGGCGGMKSDELVF